MLILIKKNLLLLSISLVFIYFIFNLLGGERGLISWYKKSRILNDLENKNNVLTSKIENLELKNSLLKDNIDIDFIETLIRDKFVFGKKGEKTYIIKYNEN